MPAFIYSPEFAEYDFGPEHPLKSKRLAMTYELVKDYGAFDVPGSRLVPARPATEVEVLTAHDEEYVEVVKRASRGEWGVELWRYGLGLGDNPTFPGMYEASLLYAGASVQAAELVASGEEKVAFNISGGLHHAMRNRASGFCIFNDPAIAIHRLLEKFERVAYIDIDAHHGDGVQDAFYASSRVLTVSVHESGRWLFPGTGFVEEIGEGEGIGFSVNLPVAPNTDDGTLLRVLRAGALPVLRAFDPEVIVAQLGADGHYRDPLAHLNYTTASWLEAVKDILSLGRPMVALGGGGYDPTAVCRMWTLAYGEMIGVEFPDEIPYGFARRYGVARLRDVHKPELSASEARQVATHGSNVLEEVRRLVFPHWPEARLG